MAKVFGTCSPMTMWSEEKTRKPIRKAIRWMVSSGMPSGASSGVTMAATVGSPTQPRPSEAMVMPSWQQAR